MSKIERLRKRPVEVETMLWDGTDEAVVAIKAWVGSLFYAPGESEMTHALLYVAHNGDWCNLPVGYRVAKELDGSGFYPLSPEGAAAGYGMGATSHLSEAVCHRCFGPNIVWSAPSPLWNAVMRGGSITGEGLEPHDGIVCPTCFGELADERGIARTWYLTADVVLVELETVTPSGRAWDEDARLWREPAEVPHAD